MVLISEKRAGEFASSWIRLAVLGLILLIALQAVNCESEPTESQCRPFIEKALKQQHIGEGDEDLSLSIEQEENVPTDELTETIEDITLKQSNFKNEKLPREEGDGTDYDPESKENQLEGKSNTNEDKDEIEETEEVKDEIEEPEEVKDEKEETEEVKDEREETEEVKDEKDETEEEKDEKEETEEDKDEKETDEEKDEKEVTEEENDETERDDDKEEETKGDEDVLKETESEVIEDEKFKANEEAEEGATTEPDHEKSGEEKEEEQGKEESGEITGDEKHGSPEIVEYSNGKRNGDTKEEKENDLESKSPEEYGAEVEEDDTDSVEKKHQDLVKSEPESIDKAISDENMVEKYINTDEVAPEDEAEGKSEGETEEAATEEDIEGTGEEKEHELTPEEDLTKEMVIPENLRPRDHIIDILRLDDDSIETESVLYKTIDTTLKSLKGLYDNAIKPLEILYKYRDLSNRHFGDPEIFSKPLILFMGPWSGGKSSAINYLLDNEFTEMSLRTGAEPSPAYFNILMYGEEEEVLDGTQLAADWTFSGLQKFGQSLLDRLKGYKLPKRLLEKVNIVEIPGILEIRKQVQRLFPFNDACQWFIDRADIIFLVYDPSKLDVGPETEAILDQLKGREYQTRIILNKADQVKPEELMRVQGTLIWNISPLMSSSEPPIMYTTSLWSLPYESGAPTRLLLAQERAFLRDLREAIDKRVDNKIASARRFAVRVRNHAKMVDCYLTTYYNHKTFFGNRKKISDDIIENPQKYHIYEGLSTLTNISRYDLPDPDVYRDFFKLNPLYDFKKLSDTCTYFRGCPINTLDVTIAYDLPELVGKYKKSVEAAKIQLSQKTNS